MKKNIIRIFAAVMASVMVFTAAPALNAEAANKKLGDLTIYLNSTYSDTFSISADKATAVKNLKSTKKSVVKPTSYNLDKTTQVNENGQGKSTSNYASASFQAVKPGKATVSFTAGSTKYSQNVTVKNYVVPLKSIKVNGKELVSQIKKDNFCSTSSAKTINASAVAASGWQITNMSVYNSLDNGYASFYRSWNSGVSKGNVKFSGYQTKKYGSLSIHLKNKKDKGEIYITVSLNPANK